MIHDVDARSRWAALLVTVISAFLSPFIASAINVALPPIGQELGLDAVLLGWVPTAYLLTAATCLLPVGRLADIHGRKRLFLFGDVAYTACALLAAASPSGELLIAGRALQGVGAACMFATGPAIVVSVFDPRSRGRALGWTVASVYSGLAAGPFLGGLLTEYAGWRSIFLVTVPLGLMMFALAAWGLQGDWADARGQRFDAWGTTVYGGAMIALVYGVSLLPSPTGLVAVAAGLLGLGSFVAWEATVASAILDLRLFRDNAAFALTCLAGLVTYAATFGTTFL